MSTVFSEIVSEAIIRFHEVNLQKRRVVAETIRGNTIHTNILEDRSIETNVMKVQPVIITIVNHHHDIFFLDVSQSATGHNRKAVCHRKGWKVASRRDIYGCRTHFFAVVREKQLTGSGATDWKGIFSLRLHRGELYTTANFVSDISARPSKWRASLIAAKQQTITRTKCVRFIRSTRKIF